MRCNAKHSSLLTQDSVHLQTTKVLVQDTNLQTVLTLRITVYHGTVLCIQKPLGLQLM